MKMVSQYGNEHLISVDTRNSLYMCVTASFWGYYCPSWKSFLMFLWN